MYSTKKNVQALVFLLKSHGVRHVVISPGSRNMALVASLENDEYFQCHSVVDERSAVYFAIGLSVAQGNAPVVLSCTSAQATRNYIPGMTEAYYRGTPLVVVTADYSRDQIGQGIMQAIDQTGLPMDAAKISVSLPLVRDKKDESYCVRLINEALLELNHHGTGPVHINMPVEEHWDGGVESLPEFRTIRRVQAADEFPTLSARRILVSIGSGGVLSQREDDAITQFAERHGAVVYVNHLSNSHGPHRFGASLTIESLSPRQLGVLQPDLLITIGGQIGDYAFDAMIRHGNAEHWRVHPDGTIRDTYGRLTKVFEMEITHFFEKYGSHAASQKPDPRFRKEWQSAMAQRTIPEDLPLSHAHIASAIAPRIPPSSVIHFAILSAFRNWNFFDLDPSIECHSNVAAFGIDGCLSTFLGHARGTEQRCFLVIGDLSFFYDMNALGIRGVGKNARIILINNNGGGEFRLYSHAANSAFGDKADRHIAAAGHNGAAGAWLQSMGWGYRAVRSKSELADELDWFLEDSEGPLALEVFTAMDDDSTAVRRMREANMVESVEHRIGKYLPGPVRQAAKSMLRR